MTAYWPILVKLKIRYIYELTFIEVTLNSINKPIVLLTPISMLNSNILTLLILTILLLKFPLLHPTRLFLENSYIIAHNTIYPYGLNQLVNNKILYDDKIKSKQIVYNLLNKSIFKMTQRTKLRENKIQIFNKTEVMNQLIHLNYSF